ncbi:hypothetical protein CAPTEDRAFT_155426 [Capitella teleta]|uniref:Ubiquinone biosynthesis monooxygenase COQ6, mitochondrial n=1 Tax=Capitella teleta TaxID=283909 RepID=R7V989_CAPTE|nr:hypothetical protein CAPTEDRAFT_155426 [Capitella teleta]|eukprot:ELU12926.1 hypothetical protein CAPTEDRAFT_155426 [Capitella teleta]
MMAGKRILMLEGGPEKTMLQAPPAVFTSRTCALSPATRRLLESFGAWQNIEDMRYQEVKRMQVWDSSSDSMIAFNHKDLSNDLAYIVENCIIQDAILKQLETIEDRVSVKYDCRVQAYRLPSVNPNSDSQHLAEVHLSNGERLQTRLLIGADGFKSLLRETAKIHTVNWDYDQLGVVATVEVAEEMENNVAWQRFLKTGPIALLPLSPKHSNLIWSTSTKNGRNLLQLPHDSFVDAINRAFWTEDDKNPVADYASKTFDSLLTGVGLDGSSSQQLPPAVVGIEMSTRGGFPLGLCHATHYVGNRIALIGDAAHRVHPLAGQGVNLGFGDVTCLAEKLSNAVSNGCDLGAIDHLMEYETERQRQNVPVMLTVDALSRMYGSSFTPIVLARTLGLQAVNALSPVKKFFMDNAAAAS